MILGVGINGFWRIPLAYFLTDGTNAELQTSVLRTVISRLYTECNCVVLSVTFDGLSANQKTLQNLGCSFDDENLNSLFPHPANSDLYVAAVFDPCHMLKLARNCFSEYQIIVVPGVGKAKWQHIQHLHSKQASEGLRLANKLTQAHINFLNQKMKVRLAVQIFSSSCASALEFLRKQGVVGFSDSVATETLLRTLDKVFDILNARTQFGKGFKSATNRNNAEWRIRFLEESKNFLLNLEDSTGKKIVKTKRRTFVIGLCVTIDSTVYLFKKLLLGDGVNGICLKYLPTYKFSQDNIEIMFGIIRRRGGWSNNPTALQFSYAFRAVLSHVGVVGSRSSNVLVADSDDILQPCEPDDVFVEDSFVSVDHSYCSLLPVLSSYVDNVCVYISGFVVRRLLPRLKCSDCRSLLVDVTKRSAPDTCFLELKDRGGLVCPSRGVVHVVQTAERNFRTLVPRDKPVHAISRLGQWLENAVLSDIDCSTVFGKSDHFADTVSMIDNHVSGLVRQIVRFFLDMRRFHTAKMWNIEQRGVVVRQKMTKMVLFKNQ